MSRKVIELIHVSTEGQAAAGRAGIPAQKAANRRTAEQQGLEIVKIIQMSDTGSLSGNPPGHTRAVRFLPLRGRAQHRGIGRQAS
jgi:hypothetical protein